MSKSLLRIAVSLLCALVVLAAVFAGPGEKATPLQFTVKDIDGKPVPLARYAGKVVLIVNTASKCGFTPQYKSLEGLYQKYKDRGLVILAFPANNFGAQEPGANNEIKEFCTSKYNTTFPLFSKISVAGEDQAPLYHFLTGSNTNGKFAGPIGWNFTKFLVGRDGKVINRFDSPVDPLSSEVTAAVEAALAKAKRSAKA